jgi:hypothetical protein
VIHVLTASGEPYVTSAHGEIEARFVEEDEPFDGDPPDRPQEDLSPGYDVRA